MKTLKEAFDQYEVEPSPQTWMKIESSLPVASKKKWIFLYLFFAAIVAGTILFTKYYDVDVKLKSNQPAGTFEANNTYLNRRNPKLNPAGEHPSENHSPQLQVKSFAQNSSMKRVHHPFKNNAGKYSSPNYSLLFHKTNTHQISSEKIPDQSNADETKNIQPELTASLNSEEQIQKMHPFAFILNSEPLEIVTDFKRKLFPPKIQSSSRWNLLLMPAAEYNFRVINFNAVDSGYLQHVYASQEKGIRSFSASALISYNVSTHFSIVSGVSYFVSGQERTESKIILETVSAPVSGTYAIQSTTGSMNGDASEFNHLYYSNTDSALFHPANQQQNVAVQPEPESNSIVQKFKYKEQFYFISIPLYVRYELTEHQFTPYIGLGFSASRLVHKKMLLNDRELDYHYENQLTSYLFSSEAFIGIKYRLNNHFSIYLQPSIRYGLNAINNNPYVEWIPYAYRLGGGIGYRF
jgi:hypothetical protein